MAGIIDLQDLLLWQNSSWNECFHMQDDECFTLFWMSGKMSLQRRFFRSKDVSGHWVISAGISVSHGAHSTECTPGIDGINKQGLSKVPFDVEKSEVTQGFVSSVDCLHSGRFNIAKSPGVFFWHNKILGRVSYNFFVNKKNNKYQKTSTVNTKELWSSKGNIPFQPCVWILSKLSL